MNQKENELLTNYKEKTMTKQKIEDISGDIDIQENDALLDEIIKNREYIKFLSLSKFDKVLDFKLGDQNLNKIAEIKHSEPNVVYVKRDEMEKFLNEFSIKGDDVDLSFKVVEKFEEHKDDEIINIDKEEK